MGNTFNVGRDLNAQNVAGGDIVAEAVSAVQSLPKSSDQAMLDRVLQFASSAEIPSPEREKVAGAVEAAATKPGPESRKGVLAALKGLGSVVGTVAGLAEISEAVQEWLS
ncbi:hypothetical protein [Methylobacterium phyllosphaerae]|uniref:hypothetical protein n=1 Tax=Methylobacterium phyllosphaerae TaxID=418223 RepID=UPI000AC6B620|nr:hypothetical protein [Methylobacterium phyllosphaerae]